MRNSANGRQAVCTAPGEWDDELTDVEGEGEGKKGDTNMPDKTRTVESGEKEIEAEAEVTGEAITPTTTSLSISTGDQVQVQSQAQHEGEGPIRLPRPDIGVVTQPGPEFRVHLWLGDDPNIRHLGASSERFNLGILETLRAGFTSY